MAGDLGAGARPRAGVRRPQLPVVTRRRGPASLPPGLGVGEARRLRALLVLGRADRPARGRDQLLQQAALATVALAHSRPPPGAGRRVLRPPAVGGRGQRARRSLAAPPPSPPSPVTGRPWRGWPPRSAAVAPRARWVGPRGRGAEWT